MADASLYRMLQDRFGVAVTNPPSTPLIVIEADGTCARSSSGVAFGSAENLTVARLWRRLRPMGVLLIAVSAGIGARITPCVLPLYPGFLAYLTASAAVTIGADGAAVAQRRPLPRWRRSWSGSGWRLGTIAIGGLLALLSRNSLGSVLRVALPIIDPAPSDSGNLLL